MALQVLAATGDGREAVVKWNQAVSGVNGVLLHGRWMPANDRKVGGPPCPREFLVEVMPKIPMPAKSKWWRCELNLPIGPYFRILEYGD